MLCVLCMLCRKAALSVGQLRSSSNPAKVSAAGAVEFPAPIVLHLGEQEAQDPHAQGARLSGARYSLLLVHLSIRPLFSPCRRCCGNRSVDCGPGTASPYGIGFLKRETIRDLTEALLDVCAVSVELRATGWLGGSTAGSVGFMLQVRCTKHRPL